MSDLWVIAPVFNEESSLESFVMEWVPVIRAVTGGDFTFCIINDGSKDTSLRILNRLASEFKEILVVDKPNSGHADTCLLGYQKAIEAQAEWIFQIDSDGQCDSVNFKEFWLARSDGFCHYGHREGREDGWHRRLISKVLAILLFLLSFQWVRDANVPYRLMPLEVLKSALKQIPAGFRPVQAMLTLIHNEKPGIMWHTIRFRKRSGRVDSNKFFFFAHEAICLIRDYSSWLWNDGVMGTTDRIVRIGKVFLFLFSTYYMISFLALACIRMQAFVEYDWIEAVQLSQVQRILEGLPIYASPSLEYVPLMYAPLYFYLSAALAFFTGESIATLRFVSFIATLGTLFFIGMLVWRITASKQAAWIASGLYAGMYGVVGFWFDIARVDSLFIFFTLATVYGLRAASERGWVASIWVALAAVCAVLTKQTALVPVIALCAWSLMVHYKKSRFTVILCIVSILLSQIMSIILTDSWFFYYVYKVPAAHPILINHINKFFSHDIFRHLSIGFVISIFTFFFLFKKNNRKPDAFFFLFFFLGMALAGFAPRVKLGGATNNLMPFATVLAVGGGLLFCNLNDLKGKNLLLIVFLLISFNFQVFYWPMKALPSRKVLERTRIGLNLYRSLEQPVFAPCNSYFPILANKNVSAFWGAMFDMWLTPGAEGALSKEELLRSFKERRFKSVVLPDKFFMQEHFPYQILNKYYQKIELTSFMTSEDAMKSKLSIYVPLTGG